MSMSKIDTSDARTTDAGEKKGCGCGRHARHGKRSAVQPRAAGESDTPKHGVREDRPAPESEQGSGCCGGGKAHR
jgi:hypothetical protein